METPVVAIVGRPNVGKSSLFNNFLQERRSIVSDIPGTTRDSLIDKVWAETAGDIDFWLVDTAGLSDFSGETLEEEIQVQVEVSIQNADMILFMMDGKKEPTLDDQNIIEKLRKGKVPVLFVVNKLDDGDASSVYEWAKYGLGTPMPVSASNNFGVWELKDEIAQRLKKIGFTEEVNEEKKSEDGVINIAFIGRPNAGKSSLLNSLAGEHRSVVSDVSGTTRDTIDTEYTAEDGTDFRFLDTAGLRKPGKIDRGIEFWSSVRTNRAIERSDICVILLDALEGVTHQDLVIAGKALEAGKGVIIGVNKIDLVRLQSREEESEDEEENKELDDVKMWGENMDEIRSQYMRYLHRKINFLPWASVMFFSAKTGKGVQPILEEAKNIFEQRSKRVSTAELNRYIPEIMYGHVIPSAHNKVGKIKYASQVDVCPPKFLFFVNNRDAFHFSYLRYIENKIRKKFGYNGTPITVEIKDAMKEFRGSDKGGEQ